MTITDNGWDSRAWLEGDWLHREPRRAEVRPKLLAETRDAELAAAERLEILDKMRTQVVPRLPVSAQADGSELLDRIAGVHTALVHGDLGLSTCVCIRVASPV